MPLDITFTLNDRDLGHFQGIIDQAKAAMHNAFDAGQIEAAARKLIDVSKSRELPEFITERLARLQVVIDMMIDAEWQLNDEDRERVLGALIYFCNPDDLIPDEVPGLGYLDDAIYIELILRELRAELESYEEFCSFRSAEEQRRKDRGLDPHVEREAWLADKRAALHLRMRNRRGLMLSGRRRAWHLRW